MGNTETKSRPKRFAGKNLTAAVLVSLSLVLTFSVLTPLDVILNNQRELPMPFSNYAEILILPSLLLFAAVLAVQLIAMLFGETAFRTVSALFLGAETAMCIQQLFLNSKLTESVEGTLLQKLSDTDITVNGVIFLEIFIAVPAAALYRAKKGKQAESFVGKHTVSFLACGMLLMQAAGFMTSYINNDPAKYADTYSNKKLLSYQPALSFSKEKNIIVFLTDRFDGEWCDEMLKEYPEISTELEGFTYYRNNMSPFTLTFPSLIGFLTHHEYDYSEKYDYCQKCWQGENALTALRNGGFTVNLIPDTFSVCNSLFQLEPYCDNLVEPVVIGHESDRGEVINILYQLSAVRLCPYVIKAYCEDVAGLLTNNYYSKDLYDVQNRYTNGYAGASQDIRIYEYLDEDTFNADAPKPVFSFIHLNFAHDPNPQFADMLHISGSNEIYRSSRAAFEIIFRYFREAKALGVYDNTTFIIMADHGYGVGTDAQTGAVIRPSTAVLMLKPENAARVPLMTDDETPLDNEMFSASILDYAGLDYSGYGTSFREAIEQSEEFPRELTVLNWGAEPDEVYRVEGNARDCGSWERIK